MKVVADDAVWFPPLLEISQGWKKKCCGAKKSKSKIKTSLGFGAKQLALNLHRVRGG